MSDYRDSPYLFDRPHWRITPARDFSLFFQALPRLVPAGSSVGLAGAFSSSQVITLLPQAHGNAEVQSLPDPFPGEFRDAAFLPVSDATTRALEELENQHVWPGLLLFVIVISQGQSVLEWYDAPGDPIAVAFSVPEQAVQEFAVATHGSYERVERF